jgi:hypothetical protein
LSHRGYLGRDLEILQVLLAVENNLLGLDLSVLNLYLVAAKDNRDVLADTSQISVPVGNVSISDTGSDIEHDNGALTLNAISDMSI